MKHVWTVIRGNIRRNKGSFIGILLLMFVVSVSFVTIFNVTRCSKARQDEALEECGYGDYWSVLRMEELLNIDGTSTTEIIDIQYATGGLIEAQYSYIAINALLIVIAVLAMGIGFGFRTIYCILFSTVAMEFLQGCTAIQCLPGEFLYVKETLLIPIIAGVLEAVGIGIVLRYGGRPLAAAS